MVLDKGYHINNIDLTIYSEKIKIAPINLKIRESIANILNIDISYISVKATTYEGLDAIGNNEAIACEALCLVEN